MTPNSAPQVTTTSWPAAARIAPGAGGQIVETFIESPSKTFPRHRTPTQTLQLGPAMNEFLELRSSEIADMHLAFGFGQVVSDTKATRAPRILTQVPSGNVALVNVTTICPARLPFARITFTTLPAMHVP
jgi:hypothetical protein